LGQFVQPLTKLVLTATGLLWLLPQSWALILLAIAATVIPPLAAIPVVRERDLKTRTHAGALMRFYLDAMLGLLPIRAHGAARNMQAEQEKLVGEWAASALALQRSALVFEGVQTVLVLSLVATVLLTQSFQSTAAGRVLLIVYWALNIPLLGRDFASQVRRYPFYRNLLARLVEPLEAPEEQVEPNTAPLTHAPAIEFQNASATVAGANILNGVDLAIKPGEHVAIIGPSGAGKSSLISLLLGWLPQSGGNVLVDGRPLNIEQLRRSVAWIDPAVQIWNDSLFSNIAYGSDTATHQVSTALDEAMLRPVLENLPSGLQTKLGESGGLVSGGEGQRVRFARAAIRHDANLAILDEPFRGLDRDKRRELLARSRRIWRHATMLCITHDIHQTRQFDRVIVVESGSISESGKPADLLSNPASRYSQLIAAERNNQVGLWSARFWRRIWVEKGNATESVSSNGTEAEVA
jgi:ATP-binding cassette subfamily B protein